MKKKKKILDAQLEVEVYIVSSTVPGLSENMINNCRSFMQELQKNLSPQSFKDFVNGCLEKASIHNSPCMIKYLIEEHDANYLQEDFVLFERSLIFFDKDMIEFLIEKDYENCIKAYILLGFSLNRERKSVIDEMFNVIYEKRVLQEAVSTEKLNKRNLIKI